jgi:hypothetical protein
MIKITYSKRKKLKKNLIVLILIISINKILKKCIKHYSKYDPIRITKYLEYGVKINLIWFRE